ncbi:MAG: hypothetical protein ACI35R_01865 [Bacillus sp. (in: firmicutes)]
MENIRKAVRRFFIEHKRYPNKIIINPGLLIHLNEEGHLKLSYTNVNKLTLLGIEVKANENTDNFELK